jgi:peptide/nickel transport system substrate-binding protein
MRTWRTFSVLATMALVLAACPAPAASPDDTPASEPAATDETAFEAISYPEDGPAECRTDTNPTQISQIVATDRHTVEFHLCAVDPAFLAKIAFSSFGIDDTAWLEEHAGDSSIVEMVNGTGPFQLDEWQRGTSVNMTRFDDYWGDPALAETLVFRWGEEASQRLVELQSGAVDGIDNPGPDDFETIEGDANLQLVPRAAFNVFFIGFNNTYPPFDNEQVRQAIAMGIDRERILNNFYPLPGEAGGSDIASHFAPCDVDFGCEGEEWYEYDPEAARALLTEAGFPDGFETTIFLRDIFRGYLPLPVDVATDIQSQLEENLGITATIEVQESGTFIDNSDAGLLDGIHLLGWTGDYPDITNFLDYHFGSGASAQFGDHYEDIVEALLTGSQTVDEEARRDAYEEANTLIKEHVPMIPVAHGASATAFTADIEGAHASPLGNEEFEVMGPGADTAFVWMQNAEPPGLYCADESDGEALRACEQMKESLYAFATGGVEPEPALATECTPNDDGTVWTCALREGVTFHDGAAFDANDVVLSYAVQWDAEHPLHVGRDGSFTYFSALWGGFLNPPPAE